MQGALTLSVQSEKRYDRWALYVTGAMLLILFSIASFHRMGGYGVETDFYWAYAPDAARIASGESPREPGIGPAYPLVLILANTLLQDWFASGKAVSVISSVLGGLLTYRTLRNVFAARVAFATMLLWFATVLPWTIAASTDMFFAMVVIAGIYFFFRNKDLSDIDLLLSGLLTSVAMLTRHNAIVLPMATILILLLFHSDKNAIGVRLRAVLVFCTPLVLVLTPWYAIKHFVLEPVVSDSHLIIASNFYGRPGVVSSEDMRLAAQNFDSLWAVVSYDFSHFVKHYLSNVYHHFRDVMTKSLQFPSFLFVGAGAVVLLGRMDKRQLSFFVFPALSFLLLCLVHYEPRYYLYILSFFLLLVPYFLFETTSSARTESASSPRSYLSGVVYAATLVLVLATSAKEVRANIKGEPRELLHIASELQSKIEEGSSIIARKPHLGFLAGLETIYFPEAKSIPALLEFAAAHHAGYLLYGEMEAARRSGLGALLNPERVPPELDPIFMMDNPKTIVYKIKIDARTNGQTHD